MKHIVHLVQGLEIGGLERVACLLATEMVQRGHQVTICCYDCLGHLTESVRSGGVSVELVTRKPGADLRYIWRLAKALKRLRPDVVHMHNDTALFYGTLAAMVAKVSVRIYTEQDGVFPRSLMVRLANRFLVKHLTHAVAVSQAVRELWCREDGIDPARVKVVPNCVPDTASGVSASIQRGSGPLTFGSVGRLSREKGVDVLVEAFSIAAGRLPGARLVIIGDGQERAALEALAQSCGVRERVDFLGARDDIPSLLGALDVFVLPSRREGLPMAILEAMAAGLPIIATAVGGVPEAVSGGHNGLLVAPEAPSALADAMVRLAEDASLRQTLGRTGRELFVRRYELSKMIDAYEKLMFG